MYNLWVGDLCVFLKMCYFLNVGVFFGPQMMYGRYMCVCYDSLSEFGLVLDHNPDSKYMNNCTS